MTVAVVAPASARKSDRSSARRLRLVESTCFNPAHAEVTALVEANLRATRNASTARRMLISLIEREDLRLSQNEEMRRAELKRIQREFYELNIAGILSGDPANVSTFRQDLISRAGSILDKKSYDAKGSDPDRRTLQEQRFVQLVRVRWHQLMQAAGAKPIDARGSSRASRKIGRRTF